MTQESYSDAWGLSGMGVSTTHRDIGVRDEKG